MTDANTTQQMQEIAKQYKKLKKVPRENQEEMKKLYQSFLGLWMLLKVQQKAALILKTVDEFEANPFLDEFRMQLEREPKDLCVSTAKKELQEILSYKQPNSEGMKMKIALHVLAVSLNKRNEYDVFIPITVYYLADILKSNNNTYDSFKRLFLKNLSVDTEYPDLITEMEIPVTTVSNFMKKVADFDSFTKMHKELVPVRKELTKWVRSFLDSLYQQPGELSDESSAKKDIESIDIHSKNHQEIPEQPELSENIAESEIRNNENGIISKNAVYDELSRKYDQLYVKFSFAEKQLKELQNENGLLQAAKKQLGSNLQWHEQTLAEAKSEINKLTVGNDTLLRELEQQVEFTKKVQSEKQSQTDGTLAKIARMIKNDFILLEGIEEVEMSMEIGEMLREELIRIADYFEKEGIKIR